MFVFVDEAIAAGRSDESKGQRVVSRVVVGGGCVGVVAGLASGGAGVCEAPPRLPGCSGIILVSAHDRFSGHPQVMKSWTNAEIVALDHVALLGWARFTRLERAPCDCGLCYYISTLPPRWRFGTLNEQKVRDGGLWA